MNIGYPRSQSKEQGDQSTSKSGAKSPQLYGLKVASITLPILPKMVIGGDEPAPKESAADCCYRGRIFQDSVAAFAQSLPVHMRELFDISLHAAYRKIDAEVAA